MGADCCGRLLITRLNVGRFVSVCFVSVRFVFLLTTSENHCMILLCIISYILYIGYIYIYIYITHIVFRFVSYSFLIFERTPTSV